MTVYVDDFAIPWRGDKWSHLIADTTEELHAFAARLDVHRRHFHHKPALPWKDHYDVPEAKRRQAIALGAKPIPSAEAVRILRGRRRAFGDARRPPRPSRPVPAPRTRSP